MKRMILFLGVALISAGSLVAQGSIKGNIRTRFASGDINAVEPLVNAEVFVMYGGSPVRTKTNKHGDFTLNALQPGTYTVTINSILIDTVVISDIKVMGNEMTFVKDLVVPLGRQMKPLVIIGDPPLKDANPSKEDLKKDEFEKLPDPKNINVAISLMGGGVYVSEDGRQISFRGARIGDALYIVDGIRQRGTNVSVPTGAIGSLSSWNGGVPAQYGDFTGGVVVIETMSYFDWENQQEVKRLIRKREAERESFRKSLEESAD